MKRRSRFSEKDHASSCTIMMTCPWNLSGIQRLKEYPTIEVGVHLTTISEQPFYRWGPINSMENVPSLIDTTGKYFYSEKDMQAYIAHANVKELEWEFRAQIDAALSQGIDPTHLDGHCHCHERREDIFEMALGLAREYGLPMRIQNAGIESTQRTRAYLLSTMMCWIVSESTLRTNLIGISHYSGSFLLVFQNGGSIRR